MGNHPFSLGEFLNYVVPLVIIWIVNRYYRSYLKFFKHWPLTLAILLIPMWLVLIYNFGWLTFGFNVLPFIILLTAFMLGLQLFYMVREIDRFYFQSYYLPASELIFSILTAHLVGLILLRWWTFIR